MLLSLVPRAPAQDEKKILEEKKAFQQLLDRAEDEYRRFFAKPKIAREFWPAMKFEMDTGKFDVAALHLKLLLELDEKEADADLVKIEQGQGMFPFLRLRNVPKWFATPPYPKE